jgi:non-heme chloroperoxidase
MPFVERDGARIHYREEGTGFPVVLHTGGAGDGAMWDGAGYTARLPGFRLILLDHRGRGRSSRVAGIEGHVPGAYVADVVATAAAVGARRSGSSATPWAPRSATGSPPRTATASPP